jgi:hypothetical protein
MKRGSRSSCRATRTILAAISDRPLRVACDLSAVTRAHCVRMFAVATLAMSRPAVTEGLLVQLGRTGGDHNGAGETCADGVFDELLARGGTQQVVSFHETQIAAFLRSRFELRQIDEVRDVGSAAAQEQASSRRGLAHRAPPVSMDM